MKKSPKGLSVGFLYDDTLDSSAGVAQYVKTLGSWFSAQGHRVSYLVGETRQRQFAGGLIYSMSKNLTVDFNGNRLSVPLPASRRKIKRLLSKLEFDVVHVQMPYSPFMAKRVLDRLPRSVAVVGTFHIYPASGLATIGARILRTALGRSLKRFDKVVSVSPPAAEFALSQFGLKSHIIPNTVNIASFKKVPTKAPNSEIKKIVFVGRLVKRKGCLYLLKAFSLLIKQMTNARLIIVGDGPGRSKLERYVRRRGLTGVVVFAGHISEADKAKVLSSADVACFPSLHGESFGIVLLEAMAAGARIVLGGDNPGYRSVLGAQRALLIKPRETEHFAARLQRLLIDNHLDEELHRWQQAEIKKYDVSRVGPQILSLYRSAIANRAKNRHN